jgi:ComF family protein
VWRHEGPGRELILRWKYRGILAGERLLVRALVDRLDGQGFTGDLQVVVAVPMHWRRRLARRFNQAELLARGAARNLALPYVGNALVRIRNTRSQVGLPLAERVVNVRGAFGVRRPRAVQGKCVLLVDDVVTTCATVAECSRALDAAGARAVYVASIAR